MARIRLEMPEQLLYSTSVQVQISDINYGGHLGNDRVLSLAHEARLQCLKSFGLSELDIGGVGVVMTDAAVVFKREAFHGDNLSIDVGLGEVTRRGFEFYFRFRNVRSNEEVALAKTGLVAFDYATRKIADLPESFLSVITSRA